MQLFKLFLTRSIISYLACFLLISRFLNYQQLVDNAVPQTLSRLTPPIDYFKEFVDRRQDYDRFKLMNCINYHQAVAHYFSFQQAEAYGMLGFCYERLGKVPQAIFSYQQAIASNPVYFWPYYDLGVIFYRHGQYPQAEDYFSQAIQKDPLQTVVLLLRSKVYNDVKVSKEDLPYDLIQSLTQGHREAYILLMDSLYKTGSYAQLWKMAVNGLKEGLDTDGIFYYYAGMALFYQKSYPQAMQLLQMAVQKDPRNADALLYLGMCLHLAGQENTAEEMMNKAAQLHQQGVTIMEKHLKPRVRFF